MLTHGLPNEIRSGSTPGRGFEVVLLFLAEFLPGC